MPIQQPKSPLDDIPGLVEVPAEQVASLEARLSKRFEDDRPKRIAEAEAREKMRKVRFF